MRVIAIANDGVQKRAQDSHSALNERAAEPKSSTRSTGLTSEGGGNRDGVIDKPRFATATTNDFELFDGRRADGVHAVAEGFVNLKKGRSGRRVSCLSVRRVECRENRVAALTSNSLTLKGKGVAKVLV